MCREETNWIEEAQPNVYIPTEEFYIPTEEFFPVYPLAHCGQKKNVSVVADFVVDRSCLIPSEQNTTD